MATTTKRLIFLIIFGFLSGCAHDKGQGFDTFSEALTPGSLLETYTRRTTIPEGTILREVYPKGLNLTKISEGFRNRLYNDAAGYCTIGFGHLIKKSRCNGAEPLEFKNGITNEKGEQLLVIDMNWSKYAVMKSVFMPLTEGQYAALVDFVFNVGSGNFNNSTLLKVVNQRKLNQVPGQFRRWVKANGKTWPGLVTRRNDEIDLFFEGVSYRGSEEALPEIDIYIGESQP